MITELALNNPDLSHKPVSLVGAATELDFIVGTVRRINSIPLQELESKVPEFVQRRNENAFVLGGALERIRREKFWNPGSSHPKNALFERWVEQTCHYSGRKARYLISVYTGLVQAAVPSCKIAGVGWSKLRLIAPLLKPVGGDDPDATRENQAHNDELIRLARRKSRKELEIALRSTPLLEQASQAEMTEPKPKQYVFKVRDEAPIVDAALARIAAQTGHSGGEALVDMAKAICGAGALPMLDGHEVLAKRRSASDATIDSEARFEGCL